MTTTAPKISAADREQALTWLKRGRYQLSRSHPFMGYCSWKMTFTETLEIPTLATNAQTIFYNPAYVLGCQDDQTPNYEYAISEVVHETLHALLNHCKDWEASGYDKKLVGVAQDFAINLMLKDMNLKVHKDWVPPDEKFRGKSWFEIYDILKKQGGKPQKGQCEVRPQPSGAGDGKGDGKGGKKSQPCPGIPPCDGGKPGSHDKGKCDCQCHGFGAGAAEGAKNNWDKIAVEAARFAQAHGKGSLPAFAEDLVKAITKPVVHWKTVIERWASRCKKGDYSFRRLNKRYMGYGLAMPSLYSFTADLVIAVDTSGSTWGFLNRFWGEMFGVLKATGVPTDIIECDTEPKVFRLKKPEDIFTLNRHGGGGTDFRPVFDVIAKGGWRDRKGGATRKVSRPEALIFLTDGMGDYPANAPPYKVLWCIPGAESLKGSGWYPPFGQVLSLPANETNES